MDGEDADIPPSYTDDGSISLASDVENEGAMSSSCSEPRDVYVSTPLHGNKLPFPKNRQSPIKGINRGNHLQQLVNPDNTVFSSTLPTSGSSSLVPNVKHCGFAELDVEKPVFMPFKSNIPVDIFVEVKLDCETVAGKTPFFLADKSKEMLVLSKEAAEVEIRFKPSQEIFYSTHLILTATPNLPSKTHTRKRYRVTLIGYGGTARIRIPPVPNAPPPQPIRVGSNGEYEMRLLADKTGVFRLKNVGLRTAFVYVKVLKCPLDVNPKTGVVYYEKDVPASDFSVTPAYFLLEKTSRHLQDVKLTVLNAGLWENLTTGKEEIVLRLYNGPERQRMRGAKYGFQKKTSIDSVEGMNFLQHEPAGDRNKEADLPYTCSDDLAVFKDELRVTTLCIRPPNAVYKPNNPDIRVYPDEVTIAYDDDSYTVCKR
ncbi:hypothetical protein M3Y99_00793100 [Aphelenchoides fujianensis]|nr:hypothetical protein M3Y99_00793100 [Aphelenchoides fujianensis]